MRTFAAGFVAVAALSFAGAASAQDVSLREISYSPQFQTALTNEYGAQEGESLRSNVEHSVRNALARRGIAANSGITIEIAIVDARPNAPTTQQVVNTPGLDQMLSFSIGGAELTAVLRNASGQQVAEVHHKQYDSSIVDVMPPTAIWQEAHRAIDRFAEKVADAYAAQTQAR
jgi:hypothetical protein